MTTFLTGIALLVLGYTTLNTFYFALCAVAGQLGRADDTPLSVVGYHRRIAVLIPAYKEDAVIIESVQANLRQQYPNASYDLIIMADSFQPGTLARLRQLPVQVLEVSFEVSTVAKSLRSGLLSLSPHAYDVVLVLDADNVMAPDFLSRINQAFEQGFRAVQGHRIAKNTNTPTALLDAVSEEINNHIFRQGHRVLGLSAALIGSGMAFEHGLMRSYLTEARDIGGYDKELEMFLLRRSVNIGYLKEAYLYDEKVQNPAVFERQRTRWIEAQMRYLHLHFWSGIGQLLRGNVDYFDKVFQMFVLPRVLLLGTLILGTLTGLLTGLGWLWLGFGGQLLLTLATYTLATPGYLRKRLTWTELAMVPVLFVRFLRSLLNMQQARHRFLHTPHSIGTSPLPEPTSSTVESAS